MRVEITGVIGSGKSTLAKLLLDFGFPVIFEEFKSNPFWQAFYSNPNKYNFETEITFLLQHYHDVKRKKEETSNLVCDFSFTQDLAYAVNGLNPSQLKIFKSINDYIAKELGEPTLIIYMKCSAKEAVNRIKLRGRKEEELIDEGFLKSLSQAIEDQIFLKLKNNQEIAFIEIETGKVNIISDPEAQKAVIKQVEEKANFNF